MNKTNKLIQQLATYSSVASVVIAINTNTQAELVGYDVDPDSTRFNPQDTAGFYFININNKGAYCDMRNDFGFTLAKYTNGPISWCYGNSQILNLYAYSSNYILASKSTYQYADAICATSLGLTYSCTITDTWFTVNVLSVDSYASSMANSGAPSWIANTATMIWINTVCPFYYDMIGNWSEKTDKYVGLKFKAWCVDTSKTSPSETSWTSTTHYGWIYMSVGVGAIYYTINAWAYNDTPEASAEMNINKVNFNPSSYCCETVAINDKKLSDKISIYSYDRAVQIGLSGIGNPKGVITVYNVNGHKIQSHSIKKTDNSICTALS